MFDLNLIQPRLRLLKTKVQISCAAKQSCDTWRLTTTLSWAMPDETSG